MCWRVRSCGLPGSHHADKASLLCPGIPFLHQDHLAQSPGIGTLPSIGARVTGVLLGGRAQPRGLIRPREYYLFADGCPRCTWAAGRFWGRTVAGSDLCRRGIVDFSLFPFRICHSWVGEGQLFHPQEGPKLQSEFWKFPSETKTNGVGDGGD